MSTFILASEETAIRSRAIFDTRSPADERLHDLLGLLEQCGLQPLSTSHQIHAVAGPEHPHFSAALAAYGLQHYSPCSEKIVTRTMELLVAGEVIELELLDDPCLRGLISTGLATEEDWANRSVAVEVIVRSYLAQHFEGFDLDPERLDRRALSAYSALVGGMLVAVTQARAEWAA